MTQRCKALRKKQAQASRVGLMEETWQAWRKRRLAEAHRLSLLAAGSRYGPKKRDFRVLQGSLPSSEEWLEVWSKKGSDGGMEVEEVTWEQVMREHLESSEGQTRSTAEVAEEVRSDLKMTKKFVKKGSKAEGLSRGDTAGGVLRHDDEAKQGSGRAAHRSWSCT